MSTRTRVFRVVALVALLAVLVPVGQAFGGGTVTIGPLGMFGGQEVPGPGDPNGGGDATFVLDPVNGSVCFELLWNRVGRPMAAHIHRGQAGEAGPVRVTLFSSRVGLPRTIDHVHGCVEGVETELVQRIIDNPGRYYVNVHNRRYPAGAIRGELAGGPS